MGRSATALKALKALIDEGACLALALQTDAAPNVVRLYSAPDCYAVALADSDEAARGGLDFRDVFGDFVATAQALSVTARLMGDDDAPAQEAQP